MRAKQQTRIVLFTTLLLGSLVFQGCARGKLAVPKFNEFYQSGSYAEAQAMCAKAVNEKKPQKTLLWNLQLGAVERCLSNREKSNELFDQCEQAFKYFDQESLIADAAQGASSILINDSMLPYEGEEYDRIMVNTYKGLNFASLGDFQNARVEFNRALQRQTEAKTRYAKQIEKVKTEIAEKEQEENQKQGSANNVSIEQTMDSNELSKALESRYSNLDNFAPYPDFVNPFTTYMAGLFFYLDEDREKAATILKESYGMDKKSRLILKDFAAADSGKRPQNLLWIIFENGLCPMRDEVRIDLPVFVATNEVLYTGAALPILKERPAASEYLVVETGREKRHTVTICDLDRVVLTEFKLDFKMILMREVARVGFKTFAQYQARKEMGAAAGLTFAVFQALTTAADIRCWSALPKNFQATRVRIPQDRKVKVTPVGMNPFEVEIPPCSNAILYVKTPKSGVPPMYDVIKF
jgi:hypothetical protein